MKDWQYSVPKPTTCALGEGCISAVLQCAPSVHPSPAPELTCGGFSSHVPLGEKNPCVPWDQALSNRTLLPLEQVFSKPAWILEQNSTRIPQDSQKNPGKRDIWFWRLNIFAESTKVKFNCKNIASITIPCCEIQKLLFILLPMWKKCFCDTKQTEATFWPTRNAGTVRKT